MSLAVGLLLRSLPAVAALPVKEWSAKYRNWHYYADFAVPPGPLGWADTSVIYQLAEAPGIYYMTYTVFDGVGYQVTRAESSDLLYWKTSANFIYSPRNGVPPLDWNATEGEFDYGGASFIGPLLNNYSMEAPRVLKRSGGSYWYAYYGQPRRGGLELDPGGSGFARSADGLDWERAEATPFLATSDPDVRPWEQACEYAPYLLESDGQFVVFWNAKGPNAQGQLSEESGIATLPLSAALPGTQSNRTLWRREPSNPVLKTGLSSEGQYDTYQPYRRCRHHGGLLDRPDPLGEGRHAAVRARRPPRRPRCQACAQGVARVPGGSRVHVLHRRRHARPRNRAPHEPARAGTIAFAAAWPAHSERPAPCLRLKHAPRC